MKRLGYGLGIVLLITAAAAAVAQIFSIIAQGAYEPVSLGTIWYGIHGNSLVGFQALIEKKLAPVLWVPIRYLLTLPAWLTLGVPGVILYFSCRGRRGGFDGGFA